MKLAGFNFKKINIEVLSERPEDLKINTNVHISEIKKLESNFLKTKEEMLIVGFSYDINYDPSFAKINFEGTVVLTIDPKTVKDILKQWKKKKMPEDFRMPLFNIILMKSNVKALQLEEEMGLPYHIPLPTLKPSKNEKTKK